MATVCADCKETGGRFTLRGRGWVHVNCDQAPKRRDTEKSTFPFTTMNLSRNPNDGPVKVESLRHLRQLEKTHGAYSSVYNNDSSNY